MRYYIKTVLPRVRVSGGRLGELSPRVKVVATVGIIAILALSFIVYFIFQSNYEQQIRTTIFLQERQRHLVYAKSVADNIESDLDSLMTRLEYLSHSKLIQDGGLTGPRADALLKQISDDADRIADIDSITLVDQNNNVVNYYSSTVELGRFVGTDASANPAHIQFLDNQHEPTFTNGFASPFNGSYRIALVYPIHNDETGEYRGAIVMGIVLETFMRNYGNIDDPNSLYLGLMDKDANTLVSVFKDSIGVNFYDPALTFDQTPQAREHFIRVLSGQPSVELFSYRLGERMNAGEPIMIFGKQEYSLFVVTPTAAIYSQIDSVINNQRTGFYLLQTAIAGAIAIALFFLLRWSRTVEDTVKERTAKLEEANAELRAHDIMQSEFINIAAHELRTPIQPILGVIEMLSDYKHQTNGQKKKTVELSIEELELLNRNATRLERLSSDILDASKIESGTLRLNNESFDINELVNETIQDTKRSASSAGVEVICSRANEPCEVVADKDRITRVLANLLSNAIRFTAPSGKISVDVDSGADRVKVSVRDTGSGISTDVLPKLFTKFSSSTKAASGTGLGLFISKAIVEAHGGSIWGENNPDGTGAIFVFEIPVNANQHQALGSVPNFASFVRNDKRSR
jgi:signal transduction histidine kinase